MILIVEDDLDIAAVLESYLQAAGYQTHQIANGAHVLNWVKAHGPDLILLDINLPGKDGFSLCRELRDDCDIPIIMTTAKVEEVNRLIGLEAGADDYICKPYSVKEVVARVKTNLRRARLQPGSLPGLSLDTDSFSISSHAARIELTKIEFSLFHLLYSSPGRIYSRAQIIDLVYQDYRDISDRTVDSHIRNLRKKLKALPLTQDVIKSIYGAGYKFEPI